LRKISVAFMIGVVAVLMLSTLSATARAFSESACNDGTMQAYEGGMPSTEAGEHNVPGLQNTPFAGDEVPGHMHVPEC